MGAGMGFGMGMVAGQGPWGPMPGHQMQQPQQHAAPPPPPPAEHVWHLAVNGQTSGPFSKARLGRMVTEGGFGRDTLVWTAGQDGWKRAEDVDELAQLFTVMPPPPPPAPPAS